MDKLRAIGIFHMIAKEGSLTAAADRLDLSLPTIVRTLRQLETELGVRLFNRTTRRIALTDEGEVYLAATQKLLGDLHSVEARVSGREDHVAGHVAISAPAFFGERHVAQQVPRIARTHSGLTIGLHLSDRVDDLIENRIDLAVRIGNLTSSELRRVEIGKVRQILCAAPDYLQGQDPLARPSDLANRDCIIIDGNDAGRRWYFRSPSAQTVSVAVAGPVTTNTMRAARSACLAGAGYGLFLSYQVAEDLRAGRLVRLLPEHEPLPIPVQLVHGAGTLLPNRVRAVRDMLADPLRAELRGIETAISAKDPA